MWISLMLHLHQMVTGSMQSMDQISYVSTKRALQKGSFCFNLIDVDPGLWCME